MKSARNKLSNGLIETQDACGVLEMGKLIKDGIMNIRYDKNDEILPFKVH